MGLVQAGCKLVGACDLDKKAVAMFNDQAPSVLPPVARAQNVDSYDMPQCDLLSGGPVCKAFSPGATLFGTQGSKDARNTFPHFIRALKRANPSYILIENSYGLARFKGYVRDIISQFESLGYRMHIEEIDCFDYGVPWRLAHYQASTTYGSSHCRRVFGSTASCH